MEGRYLIDEEERDIPCPICDSTQYETIYRSAINDEVIGCDCCVQSLEGWEYEDEMKEEAYDHYVELKVDEKIEERIYGE